MVLRRLFPRFGEALRDFDLPTLLGEADVARADALRVFGHARKVDAILEIAKRADTIGLEELLTRLADDSERFLRSLPYVGGVTWRHLAKNLGADVAKPDRHLVRLAGAAHRESAEALCQEIASWLDEPVAVVDLVLWRWSVIHSVECKEVCCSVLHDQRAA